MTQLGLDSNLLHVFPILGLPRMSSSHSQHERESKNKTGSIVNPWLRMAHAVHSTQVPLVKASHVAKAKSMG